MSPRELMYMSSMSSSFIMLPVVLGLLIVPYIVLRHRERRDGGLRDPQLGIKVVLHYFLTVGALIGVTGLSVIVSDLLDRAIGSEMDEWRGYEPDVLTPAIRVGFAMLVSGATVIGLNIWIILTRTNESRWPAVRRIYTGARLAISGLVGIVAFTALLIILFMSDEYAGDKSEVISVFLGVLFVWVGAAVGDFMLFSAFCRDPIAPDRGHECLGCSHDIRDTVAESKRKCPVCGHLIPKRQFMHFYKLLSEAEHQATADGIVLSPMEVRATPESPEDKPSEPEKEKPDSPFA